jgi:hypothetical protein
LFTVLFKSDPDHIREEVLIVSKPVFRHAELCSSIDLPRNQYQTQLGEAKSATPASVSPHV